MTGMRQFSFRYSFFQPAKGGMIAQSAEHLHGLGGDVFMLLEIFGQLAVNFNLTDLTRTCRIFGSDELVLLNLLSSFFSGV